MSFPLPTHDDAARIYPQVPKPPPRVIGTHWDKLCIAPNVYPSSSPRSSVYYFSVTNGRMVDKPSRFDVGDKVGIRGVGLGFLGDIIWRRGDGVCFVEWLYCGDMTGGSRLLKIRGVTPRQSTGWRWPPDWNLGWRTFVWLFKGTMMWLQVVEPELPQQEQPVQVLP